MKQLLVTIAYKIQSENNVFWKSPYMFFIATIEGGYIKLSDDYTFKESVLRETAQKERTELTTVLEKLILRTPELLEYCKLHRVGYTPIASPVSSPVYVTSQEIENNRWKKFITKILDKKSPRFAPRKKA